MEIIVDTPILLTTFFDEETGEFVGNPKTFIIETVANNDVGKMVRPYLILPENLSVDIKIWVGTIPGVHPTGWANVYVDSDGMMKDFPPDNLEDFTGIWKVTIDEPGNYSAKLEYKAYPGGVTLCSKVIIATVIPGPLVQ